jgi:hypothetical protein
MSYKQLYKTALTTAAHYQASYTQASVELNRLTLDNALNIGQLFTSLYNGGYDDINNFLSKTIMAMCLCIDNKQVYSQINTESLNQINTSDFVLFQAFPTIAADYFLFVNLLTTPPAPPKQVKFFDYSDNEKVEAFKNQLLAIDSIVRVYQVESKTDLKTPLAKFNPILGAMVINGGLLLHERITNALRPRLEQISFNVEVATVYTSAQNAKNPNNVIRQGFNRLNNSHYFQQTPMQALLNVRSQGYGQALAEIKRDLGVMARLKQDNPQRYKELTQALTPKRIKNIYDILGDRPEVAQLKIIENDKRLF